MSDQFNVTAVVTPASGLVEGAGTPFTITISGQDVVTTPGVTKTVTATVTIQDPTYGSQGTITTPITMTGAPVVSSDSVVIVGCTDTDGRQYVVAANGLSVSAVS